VDYGGGESWSVLRAQGHTGKLAQEMRKKIKVKAFHLEKNVFGNF
jgi:hypothetical protein